MTKQEVAAISHLVTVYPPCSADELSNLRTELYESPGAKDIPNWLAVQLIDEILQARGMA